MRLDGFGLDPVDLKWLSRHLPQKPTLGDIRDLCANPDLTTEQREAAQILLSVIKGAPKAPGKFGQRHPGPRPAPSVLEAGPRNTKACISSPEARFPWVTGR